MAHIQSPIPTRPHLLRCLSTESFTNDLEHAFRQSASHPRLPELNIRSHPNLEHVPCAPPPSPIDSALLSASSSSASLVMETGKKKSGR